MGIQLGQQSKLFLPCLVTRLQQERVAAVSRNKDAFSLKCISLYWKPLSFSEFSLILLQQAGTCLTCAPEALSLILPRVLKYILQKSPPKPSDLGSTQSELTAGAALLLQRQEPWDVGADCSLGAHSPWCHPATTARPAWLCTKVSQIQHRLPGLTQPTTGQPEELSAAAGAWSAWCRGQQPMAFGVEVLK